MDSFYVIINDSKKNSWPEVFWSEIKDKSTIYLDNNDIKNKYLKKLKKYHFSNKINMKFWIPFKSIWDNFYSIKYDELNENNRNFLIFQSNIKFSPHFLKKIKKEKNAHIILYLPDTISGIGIGNTKRDVVRYKKYYCIDYIYSFDKEDCQKYDLCFFDLYSRIEAFNNGTPNKKMFYIGSCRNKERLDILIKVFEKFKNIIECDFRLVGVSDNEKKYKNEIVYNSPINYHDVIKNVCNSDILLEIVNSGQTGNTLRFKEAICYDKKLLTNNTEVKKSRYYNPDFIKIFEDINDIDFDWITRKTKVEYNYLGEFSPSLLLEDISNRV